MEGSYHLREVERKSTTMFVYLRRLSNSVQMESFAIVKQIVMPYCTVLFRIYIFFYILQFNTPQYILQKEK